MCQRFIIGAVVGLTIGYLYAQNRIMTNGGQGPNMQPGQGANGNGALSGLGGYFSPCCLPTSPDYTTRQNVRKYNYTV